MEAGIKIELPPLTLSPFERNFWQKIYRDKCEEASEKWLKDIFIFLESWVNEEDELEVKTSGSTGTPKKIKVAKEALLFSARQTHGYFQFSPDEKWLLCLPASFIGGQMILVRAMVSDADVWAVEPKIDLSVSEMRFDFASMIPMQIGKLIQSEFKIRRILIGGASLPDHLEKQLQNNTSAEFYASYGMTETVSHVALRKINGKGASAFFKPLKNILIGKDDRGCLTVYHRSYSENVIITNDLVEFNSENEFRILGRYDNVINSGGLKIVPEELEKIISGIIPDPVMVSSIPDEKSGEKVILFVLGTEFDPATKNMFRNYMSDHIEKNKIPREMVFLNEFVFTPGGKPDRKKTRENYLKTLRSSL